MGIGERILKKRRLLFCLFFALTLAARAASDEVVIAGYNVENYFSSERRSPDGKRVFAPKPEKQIQALVKVIKEINPDILGVCEMGAPEDFENFKKRLAEVGLGYTDFEYVQGVDQDRHLALLSRYPIVAHESMPDVSFELNGRQEKVRRGFLDVTVKIGDDYHLRLVGAHLKSKLAVPEGEALLRRHEAQLLREHVTKVLEADPKVNLLVYGDFNETKNEPAIKEIMGPRDSHTHLYDLWLKDSLGDRWTHYWRVADSYERIDFLFANRFLLPEVVHEKCSIYRSDYWNEASDHRAIIATIKPAPGR